MNEITKILEKILGFRLSYYDPKGLTPVQRNNYKGDARMIVDSEVFNNELNHLISDITRNTVMFSENFDQVQHARTSILQLEEFKHRLESVEEVEKAPTAEDVNEAI